MGRKAIQGDTWQEAFVREGIWPDVLDWYLYQWFAPFPPIGMNVIRPKVYNVLVVVGCPGKMNHNLHVPLEEDHAKRIATLFDMLNPTIHKQPSRRITVREYFDGGILVGWDEKPCGKQFTSA